MWQFKISKQMVWSWYRTTNSRYTLIQDETTAQMQYVDKYFSLQFLEPKAHESGWGNITGCVLGVHRPMVLPGSAGVELYNTSCECANVMSSRSYYTTALTRLSSMHILSSRGFTSVHVQWWRRDTISKG